LFLLLIANKASEEQSKEIIQIVYRQTKGDSFELFTGTFGPLFVDINSKIDGRKRVTFLHPYNEWWSDIFSKT
jgi:hypothetical protein